MSAGPVVAPAPRMLVPVRRPFPPAAALGSAAVIGLVAGLAVLVDPRLALVPPALLVAGWAVVRAPGVALGAYLFLPFYKAALTGVVPIDLTVLLAALNALQLGPILMDRGRGTGEARGGPSIVGTSAWVGFGILLSAGVMWAVDPALAASRAVGWWLLVVAPLAAAYRVATEPRFVDQLLVTGFAVGAVIVVLAAPGIFGAERLAAAGENTLQTGAITLIVAILAGAWLLPAASRPVRLGLAAVAAVGIVESIASGSRGPLLAFGVVGVLALIRRVRATHGVTRSEIIPALGLLALAAIVVVLGDRLPGASLARLGQVDEAVAGRTMLWSAGLQLFAGQPLLGVGPGGFAAWAAEQPRLLEFTYPHNDLVQVAAELGVVGLVVIAPVLVVAFGRSVPAEPRWVATRAIAVFMLVLGMVAGDVYGDRLLWGLVVLQLAAPISPATRPVGPTERWTSSPPEAPGAGPQAPGLPGTRLRR